MQENLGHLDIALAQKGTIVKLLAPEYSVKTVCKVIAMPRSSYYHKPNVSADEALRTAMLNQAKTWPTYGYRRLTACCTVKAGKLITNASVG